MNTRAALAAVPREPFIPEEIFVRGESGWLVPLRRSEDPDRWHELVAADAPVVTRTMFDPDIPTELLDAATGRGVEPTSSSSAPFIMAYVLDALELTPGMRVLEIGTGTGYNAAVLAHLLGAENVVSVEIDSVAADRARDVLHQVGYPVQVITGDGEDGYPPGAPYDRIIATAAVDTVPVSWVDQTRPSGMIVAPWAATFHPDAPLCRLTVDTDHTAHGCFLGPAFFMPMHGQRAHRRIVHEAEQRWVDAGKPDCTRYGVTVTPQEQWVWLDEPENPASGARVA